MQLRLRNCEMKLACARILMERCWKRYSFQCWKALVSASCDVFSQRMQLRLQNCEMKSACAMILIVPCENSCFNQRSENLTANLATVAEFSGKFWDDDYARMNSDCTLLETILLWKSRESCKYRWQWNFTENLATVMRVWFWVVPCCKQYFHESSGVRVSTYSDKIW